MRKALAEFDSQGLDKVVLETMVTKTYSGKPGRIWRRNYRYNSALTAQDFGKQARQNLRKMRQNPNEVEVTITANELIFSLETTERYRWLFIDRKAYEAADRSHD